MVVDKLFKRHCLVLHLLDWYVSIESLMRSLVVVVMRELFKPFSGAGPTANPGIMEAVDPHFEGMKPLFEVVSINVVEVTAQPYSREGSQTASTIDEKLSAGETVVLGESMQKRSSWIGASPTKGCDIENEFRVEVYCSVRPRSIAVTPDSGFVNRDPRRRSRPQNMRCSDGPHESEALVDVGGFGTLSASRCTQCQIA